MIQEKVGKKNRAVLMHHFQYSQSKITDNKSVYFCNKIWSLKETKLSQSVKVKLVYMQYNISDGQARF